MSTSEMEGNITLVAAAAITPYRFVEIDSSGLGDPVLGAAGDEAVGVANMAAATGDSFPCQTLGGSVAKIELGATLAAGARVMSDTDGTAIASATAGSLEMGTLLGGGDAGQIVSMILQPVRRHAA